MTKRILIFLLLFFSGFVVFSQEAEEEDPDKLIREVVKLEVDKAKFAPPPAPVATNTKKGKKKKVEEPPPEPVADTGNPMMPAPVTEVLKRAQHWFKVKNKVFVKSNGTNSGSAVSSHISFNYKQKVFNALYNIDGKIVMDIVIEAKEGKYRYTIKNIKHQGNDPKMSGGDIYLLVPECGSGKIEGKQWVKIKAEALANAQIAADELKATMKKDLDSKKDDW